ncbi:hypothetical protein H5410_014438 [Solanum commersonii]|uniref:Uncharacterized protein n=1 Tax=Solanum commersonii TaxID=4109 RepID=A0A9J5ZQZ3_SOLCO|nr:hypothetical protein H5410_014438 [Solanum commersonii]
MKIFKAKENYLSNSVLMCCEGSVSPVSQIADPLGDPPVGIASRNCSTTCRLLFSISNFIFSFRAWYIGTLSETKAIWRFSQWFRRSSGLIFFVLLVALFRFGQ